MPDTPADAVSTVVAPPSVVVGGAAGESRSAPPASAEPASPVSFQPPPLGVLAFAGTSLLAASATVLAIVLVRVHAAIFGAPFAVLALTAPLFGAAVAGLVLHFLQGVGRGLALHRRMAHSAGMTAAASVVAVVVAVHLKPIEAIDKSSAARIAALYLTSALPFFFAWLGCFCAMREESDRAGRTAFACAAGAAMGAVLVIPGLRVGGPRAGLLVAIAASIAALLFYEAARRAERALRAPESAGRVLRPSGGVVATYVLASVVLFAGDLGEPWLKLKALRWATSDKIDFEVWTELGVVTVEKPTAGIAPLRVDGAGAPSILEQKTQPPASASELVWTIVHDKGPILVVGPGGGADVRAALKAGQKDIDVIEPNPVIATEVMAGRFKDFGGALYDKPEVHIHVGDVRSYVRSTTKQYAAIVVPSDESAALPALGLALDAQEALTVEAFADDLARLGDQGALVVSRPEVETDRLLGLAAAALRRAGVEHPEHNIYAAALSKTTAVILRKSPFSAAEVTTLRRTAQKAKDNEAFAPDVPHSDTRKAIVVDGRAIAPAPATPGAVAPDLSAPPADRPFFSATSTPASLVSMARSPSSMLKEHADLASLFAAAACGLVLLLASLSAFGAHATAAEPRPGRARQLLYFAAAGAGIAIVATAVGQRLVLFLGQPVAALSVVLAVLLLAMALGSLRTARLGIEAAEAAAARRAEILASLLAVLAAGLSSLLERLIALPLGARLAIAVAVLAPIGLLSGALLPLGVKIAGAWSRSIVSWSLAASAAAAVAALGIGVLLTLALGYSAAILVAGLAFLVARAAIPRAPARRAAVTRAERPAWLSTGRTSGG